MRPKFKTPFQFWEHPCSHFGNGSGIPVPILGTACSNFGNGFGRFERQPVPILGTSLITIHQEPETVAVRALVSIENHNFTGKGQAMTLEKITITESERVQRLIDEAFDEIEEQDGDMKVFIICLLDAVVHLYASSEGEDTLAKAITQIGMHELKRRGVKPC